MRIISGGAVLLLVAVCAAAQDAQEGATVRSLNELPPAVRLGVRAESVIRKLPVVSAVVVVPDAASYVGAIARWGLEARYPVLIDDGSARATEDIARFVRAFSPAHVYAWSADDGEARRGPALQGAVERAVASAWGVAAEAADPVAAARERWKELGLRPCGMIAADAGDPAWAAALALSAGRGEPIGWLSAPPGVSRAMSAQDMEALSAAVEGACAGWEYSWAGLGDDIDAVTLCLNSPVKFETGEREWSATTDRVGRRAAAFGGSRWAWAGQIFGDEASAAYAAMCSIFLHPSSAWLFEGYPPEAPWTTFSETEAGEVLRQTGLQATVLGGSQWRPVVMHPVDAGLICVNTKGNRDFFDLGEERRQAGDVPFLARPAMVYLVHSWSANAPSNRATVAGRWLERGAYAYLGSVQEPMLHAFVPTPMLAARLGAGAVWGAAVRLEDAPVWRLAVIGDPLVTLGTALGAWPARVETALPLEGAEDLSAGLKAMLDEKKYAEALRTLVVLGRDDAAARLAAAVLNDEPDRFDAAAAGASIMPLFRAGRRDDLLRAFAHLDVKGRADGVFRDAVWNAFGGDLASTSDLAAVSILSEHLREDQIARDALDLVGAVERVRGAGAGGAFLSAVREKTTDRKELAELDKALRGRR
jgi:hypothetical protein